MNRSGKNIVSAPVWALLLVLGLSIAADGAQQSLSTTSLRSMARAYMAFGKYDKAHVLAEKALLQAKKENIAAGEMALCMIDFGTCCSYEGFLDLAQKNLLEGSKLQKQALFAEHPYVAHTLRMLSDVYLRQGKLTTAESTLSDAFRIMLKNCDLQSKEMAPFIAQAAQVQFARGEVDKAQSNYVMAIDLYETVYGANHLATANLQESYAKLLIAQNDYQQADELLNKSMSIKTRIFGRYHMSLVDNWLAKADLCRIQGQSEKCEYYLAKISAAASQSTDVVAVARIYEKINRIRSGGLLASANL